MCCGGCIGIPGLSLIDHEPAKPWDGWATRATARTTQPIKEEPHWRVCEEGVTAASPEVVLASARSLIEPRYGPTEHLVRNIENGNIQHRLITPRFNVSNGGWDYKWIEITVLEQADTRLSYVEIHEVSCTSKVVAVSAHGGVWLFPPRAAAKTIGENEHILLVALLQDINDPNAYIK